MNKTLTDDASFLRSRRGPRNATQIGERKRVPVQRGDTKKTTPNLKAGKLESQQGLTVRKRDAPLGVLVEKHNTATKRLERKQQIQAAIKQAQMEARKLKAQHRRVEGKERSLLTRAGKGSKAARRRVKKQLNREAGRQAQREARYREDWRTRFDSSDFCDDESFESLEESSSEDWTHHAELPVASAEVLGFDDAAMFNRLLTILAGDTISPEDYDVLRQLDTNNVKSTVGSEVLAGYEVLVVGDLNGEDKEILINKGCSICLQDFDSAVNGLKLRRLPCGHAFCKHCIDHWLTSNSTKCPELSCFWVDES